MQNKKNILFIIPSLARAGAETQLVDLMNGLNNEKFGKYLFTFENRYDQLERVDQANIMFFNKQRRHKYDLIPIAREVAHLIDRYEIEILHCTLQFSLLIASLALYFVRSGKPRLVAAIHTTQNRSLKEELQDRIVYQRLLQKCSKIVFVCQKQQEFWINKYPSLRRNSVFVYNGIDTQYYNPEKFLSSGKEFRGKHNIADDANVLCCVARFRPEKGHEYLLQAFKKLEGSSHLFLAGGGETKEQVEALVRDLDLDDRVHFLGSVSDVRPLLAASDISILASTAVETFSMTMLESMSMGVPVVATDIGGMSEAVIPNKTGYLTVPKDVASLTQSIRKCLDNPDQRRIMGQSARQMVQRNFSLSGMVANMENVLLAL